MQLSFLPSHGFRRCAGPGGTLHIRGHASLNDTDLRAMLAEGHMPEYLRGNFAFVFEGVTETIAAVDHVATYPLFYTDGVIGGDFVTVAETKGTPIKTSNAAACMLDALGGLTFNGVTSVKGVEQMLACHYWRAGHLHRFIDLESVDLDPHPDLDEFRAVVESVVARGCVDHNALLLSAGTDSVTLAGITRKLGLQPRFDYVHVYSAHQPLTDKAFCEEVAQEMQLAVTYNEQRYTGKDYGGLPYYRTTINWRDHAFAAKRAAMIEAGCADKRLVTGECGDQLFGGPKNELLAKYCAQFEDAIDPAIIAHLWINQSTGNPYTHGLNISPKLARWRSTRKGGAATYDVNVQLIGDLFQRLDHLPYMARFMRMNLILKGPYRTYAYAQDDLDWWSPFADWEIVSRAIRLGPKLTMPGGQSKGILLNLWRDWVSPRPWLVAKSGIMIPNAERHRA